MLRLFGLNPYIPIGALLVVLSLTAWALFERSARHSMQLELERKLGQCELRLNTLHDRLVSLQENEARARAQAAQARRKAEEAASASTTELQRLAAIRAKPTPAGDCPAERAWEVIER